MNKDNIRHMIATRRCFYLECIHDGCPIHGTPDFASCYPSVDLKDCHIELLREYLLRTETRDDHKEESSNSGRKDDSGKVDVSIFFEHFPRSIVAISKCSEYGANIYGRDNWKDVADGERRYAAAQGRHLLRRMKGETVDKESGLPHLYHEVWNALAKLELHLINEEKGCWNEDAKWTQGDLS
jgi:hypothetical protein